MRLTLFLLLLLSTVVQAELMNTTSGSYGLDGIPTLENPSLTFTKSNEGEYSISGGVPQVFSVNGTMTEGVIDGNSNISFTGNLILTEENGPQSTLTIRGSRNIINSYIEFYGYLQDSTHYFGINTYYVLGCPAGQQMVRNICQNISAIPPQSVPTLSQWALLILVGLIGFSAITEVRRFV